MDNQPSTAEKSSGASLESDEQIHFVQAGAAAKMLGVHAATLIRWARQGRIPAYAAPGNARTSWLFDVPEIARIMRENSQQIAQKRRHTLEVVPLSRERVADIVRQIRRKHLARREK